MNALSATLSVALLIELQRAQMESLAQEELVKTEEAVRFVKELVSSDHGGSSDKDETEVNDDSDLDAPMGDTSAGENHAILTPPILGSSSLDNRFTRHILRSHICTDRNAQQETRETSWVRCFR